jgi:flagellin-like protein
MHLKAGDRGVTPAIGVILTVAIVVVLATVVGASVLAYTDAFEEPAPRIGQSSAQLVPNVAGSTDQTIEMTHIAGDEVEVQNLDVVIDAQAACGKTTRLVDPTTTNIDPDDLDGPNFLDDYGLEGEFGTGSNEVWSPSETVEVRINNGGCDIASGEQVTVRVVHTPSETVIIGKTLTAQ